MTNGHTFTVLEWKPFEKNTLRGFLSLQLPSGMILHDVTLHEKNGARWIGLPAKPYEKAGGSKSWTPIVEFVSKETRDKFQEAALKAVDEHPEASRS